MSPVTGKSGSHVVRKNDFVSLEGARVSSLNLMLQGNLNVYLSSPEKGFPVTFEDLAQKSYRLFGLDQNIFIGANDLLQNNGCSSLTITAAADCNLYAYEADNPQSVMAVIYNQKDYGAYVINSICNLIDSSYRALQKLSSYSAMVADIYKNLCIYYMAIAEEYRLNPGAGGISAVGAAGLASRKKDNLQTPTVFSRQFIESGNSGAPDPFHEADDVRDEIEYYRRLYTISTDVKKAFFAADRYIADRHIKNACACLEHVLQQLRRVVRSLEETIDLLYGENEDNIYSVFIKAAGEMASNCIDCSPALEAASYLYGKLADISGLIEYEYGRRLGIDFKYFEHSHINAVALIEASNASNSNTAEVSSKPDAIQTLPEELTGSAEKLLQYAEIPEDKATCFMMNLTAFRNLKDRLSTEGSAKNIRSAITELYFDVYQAVFRKAYHLKDNSRLVRMFLSFGYMDERLLDYDQIMSIYKLAGMEHATGKANVYFMQEWLTKIYDMEKNPSVDNFGHDYLDTFRELKKRGQLTDSDKTAYINDREGRLSFEIRNMFRLNHKLCHGQIAFYFPILHSGIAPHDPARAHVTPAVVNEKLSRILDVDYSAFHREVHYRNSEKGIEKEIVMMQVLPDFILIPVYGTRAMMWQEISGRHRNSPGRMLLPVFTDENLDDMFVRLVGNFRWELCRTMMGTAWNNVSQLSLTSEYADYIQFYRKNRELVEEAKEKVKLLTVKYRNKLRDIFTSDYEIWINNESKGNPRLNKVARGILFRHCPFSREIREFLERQPIYTELINISGIQKAKKTKDLENRYKSYIKSNGVLDPALMDNLSFYRDL